jgi:hypothetical protein
MRLDSASGCKEKDVHSSLILGIAPCAHSKLGHAVAIQVVQTGDASAEPVRVAQRIPKKNSGAGCVRDLLVGLHTAVGLEEKYPHSASVAAPIVVVVRAHSNVRNAVGIEVA